MSFSYHKRFSTTMLDARCQCVPTFGLMSPLKALKVTQSWSGPSPSKNNNMASTCQPSRMRYREIPSPGGSFYQVLADIYQQHFNSAGHAITDMRWKDCGKYTRTLWNESSIWSPTSFKGCTQCSPTGINEKDWKCLGCRRLKTQF